MALRAKHAELVRTPRRKSGHRHERRFDGKTSHFRLTGRRRPTSRSGIESSAKGGKGWTVLSHETLLGV
jgi:hypothetical protein